MKAKLTSLSLFSLIYGSTLIFLLSSGMCLKEAARGSWQ